MKNLISVTVERPLQWRHNKRDSVSNHQPHDCLFNCLFRHKENIKHTINLAFTKKCTLSCIMKIKSRFVLKTVFYWTSKSAISVEKGVFFFRPESAKRGCFQSLGTSVVYILVGGRGAGDLAHNHDLGLELSRSTFEIALSREWKSQLIWNERDVNLLFTILTVNFVWGQWMYGMLTGWLHMMTSSNGNTFRVTGPLCGEFIGPGEFPAQRPVTRSFAVFFGLHLNKRLSKQSWGWWFETMSRSLWRHCNETSACRRHV